MHFDQKIWACIYGGPKQQIEVSDTSYLDGRCAQQSAGEPSEWIPPNLLDYISVRTISFLGFIAHNWGYLLCHYSPFLYIFICFSFQFLMLFLPKLGAFRAPERYALPPKSRISKEAALLAALLVFFLAFLFARPPLAIVSVSLFISLDISLSMPFKANLGDAWWFIMNHS